MTADAQHATEVVQCKQHYPHAIEKVFTAWSDPNALGQWFGPQSHKCQIEHYDFTEGGHYRIRLIPLSMDTDCGAQGEDSVCIGSFVKIAAPNVIVLSFSWEGSDMGDTLLTIELNAVNGGTDIVLTHEKIPGEELRQAHNGGWTSTLESLLTFLTK